MSPQQQDWGWGTCFYSVKVQVPEGLLQLSSCYFLLSHTILCKGQSHISIMTSGKEQPDQCKDTCYHWQLIDQHLAMHWGASHLLSQKKKKGGGGVHWSKLLISALNNVQRLSAVSKPLVCSAFIQQYYRLKAMEPSVISIARIVTRHEWEKLI